jgi:hypothetical protein
MPTQWREIVSNELKKIIEQAEILKDFLNMFPKSRAEQLPLVGNLPAIVGETIEMLEKLINIARTIETEISKEEIDWEKIKKVFPLREWLGSLERNLFQLDESKEFRRLMPYYRGSLLEQHFTPIWNAFRQILDVFTNELGRTDIHTRFMEAPKKEPPTEEELEREYEEATGKRTPRLEDLPSLFDKISGILTQEFGGKQGFHAYWEGIARQFESALRAGDIDELRDVYRQVKVLFESLPEAKRETYANIFNQFFTAVRDYALPLLKFKLVRRLLGLE